VNGRDISVEQKGKFELSACAENFNMERPSLAAGDRWMALEVSGGINSRG
jgi:hypothetical protein